MPSESVRAHVVLPKPLVDAVDRQVGQRGRSRFVAEAVDEKLARLRLARAATRAAGSLHDVDVPGWETSESSSEWGRDSRRADDDRLRASRED